MPTETRTLEVPVYRCNDGLPICEGCPMFQDDSSECGWDGAFLEDDNNLNVRPSPNCPLRKREV